MSTLTPAEKVTKAKVQMRLDSPFFSYIALHLKVREVADDPNLKTMAVSAEQDLFYDPVFVEKMNSTDMKLNMVHEILHIALQHMIRFEGKKRDRQIANIAMDVCVNKLLEKNFPREYSLWTIRSEDWLKKEGWKTIDRDWLEKKFRIKTDPDTQTWEVIYDIIFKAVDKDCQKKYGMSLDEFKKQHSFDKHIVLDNLSEKDKRDLEKKHGKSFEAVKEDIEHDLKKRILEAAEFAKAQGKDPAGFDRYIDKLFESKLGWKSLLYKYVLAEVPFDYTYMRRSKKSMGTPFYTPGTMNENLNVIVGVDTSGSISKKELTEFMTEVVAISRAFANIKMKVVLCDAAVQKVIAVENGNIDKLKDLKLLGGGGTDFRPVFKYAEEEEPHTKLVVYLTDGYGTFPRETSKQTIWVICENGIKKDSVPFGESIKLSE